ncbi:RDD family protein [Lysobacter sp. TY2-98]|uniref:RDD family protein n=1 Tax=Lysobacter sp. TY2-98 TaxID=2290922 RepID=UPI000E201B88|nr:RDD family protein [Lysobacter sp. TY2-98]AXK73400.1 RDD family protein [Lysobacter sp. TY2-98]
MSTWYYSDAQRNRLGPVGSDDLAQLHANGQLAPEVLVWREGMPEWKPWRDVMAEVIGAGAAAVGVAPPAPPRATFAVADDGGGRNPYEVVERVTSPASPYAAPAASLSSHAAIVHDGEVVYAGFWKRYSAYIIDSFIVGIVGFIVQMVVAGVVFGGMAALQSNPTEAFGTTGGIIGLIAMYVTPLLLQAAYFGFFHASANQATLGKMAIGIKLTDDRGGHISFWRGFGRYFAMILSTLILFIGFVMAGFTDRKRALHDMICSTLVVDKWAFTNHPERQRRELGVVTIVIMVLSLLAIVGYFALIGVFIAAMASAGAH